MQILEAFDLTRSFRDAGELAGCDHKTVAHWVTRRDAGAMSAEAVPRPRLIDPFLPKLEEWMEASKGKVRADIAHDKLVALGFTGSERTTRRATAEVRAPVEMLAEEVARLHPLPEHPYTTAFGLARTVGVDQPTIQLDWGIYSVPSQLAGMSVWVRRHGNEVVVTHLGAAGPVEVARHEVTTPGNPRIDPAHYPPSPESGVPPTNRTLTYAASWSLQASSNSSGGRYPREL